MKSYTMPNASEKSSKQKLKKSFANKGELFPESMTFAANSNNKESTSQTETLYVSDREQEGIPDISQELTTKPLKKYKFIKSIGYGGMKTVLEVRDKDTFRDVAMAIMPDADCRPLSDRRRFIHEARITAGLEHPNIVPVHDIGIDALDSPYFTMKLLKGETLASIIKKLAADDKEYIETYDIYSLLRVFMRVCNAIAFAHSKKVIHLDLKPENIQVGDFGEVLVLDWGLAKIIKKGHDQDEPEDEAAEAKEKERSRHSPQLTLDGVTKGTPGFMGPEQAAGRNREKDERTDIYALGAILYTLLTWTSPFSGKDIDKILLDTVNGNLTPPRERRSKMLIPSALEAVVMKAMEVAPDNRYQSVNEIRADVLAFMGGFATSAEKASVFKKSLLLVKRHRLASAFLSIILFLLIFLGVYALQDYSSQTAGWKKVYETDFMASPPNTKGHVFMDRFIKEKTDPWPLEVEGLKMVLLRFVPQ